MALAGTVVNGRIVLDSGIALPEGARVRVELTDEADADDAPPPTAETYEEHLAALRQSLGETKAGVGGMPLAQFAAELEKEFGRPLGLAAGAFAVPTTSTLRSPMTFLGTSRGNEALLAARLTDTPECGRSRAMMSRTGGSAFPSPGFKVSARCSGLRGRALLHARNPGLRPGLREIGPSSRRGLDR